MSIRTLNDLLIQQATKHQKKHPQGLWCNIVKVYIPSRMLAVNAKAYHGPRKVGVVPSINLGPITNPLIHAGDQAFVEQDKTGKYWATKVHILVKCFPTTSPNVPNVPLPSQLNLGSISDLTNFTPNITQLQPFNPNFIHAGLLSPPALQAIAITYDASFSYLGTIPAGTIQQGVALLNGTTWNHFFVSLTGTADAWNLAVNGATIASGSGAASYQALGAPATFANGSTATFTLTASGTSSNLFCGVGV